MHMQRIYIVIAFILLLGCASNPEGIIPEDQFINVLVDIHKADGILAVKGYNVNRDSTKIELLYQDVINKHQITQKQFKLTMEKYTADPREFEKIYEQVSEKLSKMESELDEVENAAKEAKKVIKDSIK